MKMVKNYYLDDETKEVFENVKEDDVKLSWGPKAHKRYHVKTLSKYQKTIKIQAFKSHHDILE